MLKSILCICLCSLFWATGLVGQSSESLRLERLEFEGLTRTKTDYLRTFIQSQSGAFLASDSTILSDVQRLKNIPSIATATYRLDTLTSGGMSLAFVVEEKRTLLPIVNFGGIRDNFWFQLGFTDINWLGKGQLLEASYQNNDRRHNGQVFYRVPYLRDSEWGYALSLRKYSSIEPLYFTEGTVQYNYDNYSLGASGIRHLGYHRQLEFGLTLFREAYEQSAEQSLTNPPGPQALQQNKSLGKIAFSENHLAYDAFYLSRYTWTSQYQVVYNFSDASWFQTFNLQYLHFWRPFATSNLALRLRLGISTNNDTPFAPFVVDSNVNLRGAGNRIDRGTAQFILNLEYRQTLLDRGLWATQAIAFSDAGTWRNSGGNLEDLWNPDLFRQFVGAGFRVVYKKIYQATLRIDYGVDLFNPAQRGWVIGVGQYF